LVSIRGDLLAMGRLRNVGRRALAGGAASGPAQSSLPRSMPRSQVRAKKPPRPLRAFPRRGVRPMSRAKPRAVQSNTNGNSNATSAMRRKPRPAQRATQRNEARRLCHVRSRNSGVCPPPATRHAMQPGNADRGAGGNSGTARRYPSLSPRRATKRGGSPRRRSGIPRLPGEAAPGERAIRAQAPCPRSPDERARWQNRRDAALRPDRGAKPSSG